MLKSFSSIFSSRNFKFSLLAISFGLITMVSVYGGIYGVQAQEEVQSHATVQVQSNSSVADGLQERAKDSWPWYVTRASGLVAAGTLVILMLSGVGLITGHTFSFLEPITAWASHRALGIAFAVSVVIHVAVLMVDNFVPFSLMEILVPFASDFKSTELFGFSVGSLYVALGVLSLYMVFFITLTSLLWIEKKPKLWKWTHFLSYLTMFFVFLHGLHLGTDLASGLLRWIWIGSALVISYAVMARLWRANTV